MSGIYRRCAERSGLIDESLFNRAARTNLRYPAALSCTDHVWISRVFHHPDDDRTRQCTWDLQSRFKHEEGIRRGRGCRCRRTTDEEAGDRSDRGNQHAAGKQGGQADEPAFPPPAESSDSSVWMRGEAIDIADAGSAAGVKGDWRTCIVLGWGRRSRRSSLWC